MDRSADYVQLRSIAAAYQLPGDPHDIELYKHHDYVYLLTVGDRQYVANTGIDWSEQVYRRWTQT